MTKKYLRMTLNERVQHLNLFVNFTILVITGFTLKYPEVFWSSSFSDSVMGTTLRGLLHRLSGVAVLTLGGYHILYLLFTERGRGILIDMIPQLKDGKDLWETLKNNLFINRPAKEIKMGRFNFREKFEYLGLIWGTMVMTVTGFILWFKTEWLHYFPMWSYNVALAVHYYEAILATLTIIVWHLYAVVWNPDVYPMSWAWVTGDLTEHEMELEHGLELEKIKVKEKGRPVEYGEAGVIGGGRVSPLHPMEESTEFSIRGLYGIVKKLNETIKNWRGD
jgi:cytochrome b subunit of formate dehydrogenase